MREKREKTHTEIQDFMDNKLGVILSDLRRELKLTEARLRDNHQVFINQNCNCSRCDYDWQKKVLQESPKPILMPIPIVH